MHILVNGIPLNGLVTGISRYVRCLYEEIQKIEGIKLAFFTSGQPISNIPSPPDPKKWTLKTDLIWKLPDPIVTGIRAFFWLNYERNLKKVINHNKYHLYHETTFFPPAVDKVPVVFSLYDLSLLKYKDYHPKERVWFFKLFFKRRLSYATHIITISEFLREEIITELKFPPSKVSAIPLAPSIIFYPRTNEQINSVLNQFKLPSEYILFVGTIEPRKNLVLLLEALKIMKTKVPLVIAGWKGWGEKQLKRKLKELGLEKQVFLTGYVDNNTLACLYSGAQAFVYPSLYEGFGLPVLEAMACGCPVICSNKASLPEVAGEAALYIDPYNPESLANTLERLLTDTEMRKAFVKAGLKRTKQFSWQKTALKTIEVFKQVSR